MKKGPYSDPVAAKRALRAAGYWPTHTNDGIDRWARDGKSPLRSIARVARHYEIVESPKEVHSDACQLPKRR